MRIGLVSYRCENRNIAFNMRQIELAIPAPHADPAFQIP